MMFGPCSKSAATSLAAAPLLLLLLGLLLPCACEKSAPKAASGVPVEAKTARLADVPITVGGIGQVKPLQKVTIRAQLDGYVQEVLVKEGQKVEAGQVLFRLDARKFEVARQQASATLEQAKIQAQNARKEAERAEGLRKGNMISAQDYEALSATAEALAATVRAQEAQLKGSALTLEFCTLRAPFAGRVGTLSVNVGDLVKANDTPFITLNRIAPIRVAFSVPESELGAVRAALSAREVAVTAQSGPERVSGKLVSIDNEVDPKTGSILLTAEFANEKETLWPGQYVDVEAQLGTRKDVVLVPAEAVQVSQNGSFVFVIEADKTARVRKIVAGPAYLNELIVNEGLKAQELVVTDGQLRLGEKTRVELRGASAPRPASAK